MHFANVLAPVILGFSLLASAHPGEEHEERNEVHEMERRDFKINARRGLESCAEKLERRGINARAQARRQAAVNKYKKRALAARDTDTILATSHLSTGGQTTSTSEEVLFSTNSTCVLNPEAEIGPYWVKGEHIRSDLRDSELGVPVILDGQFVDVETCEPIEGLYWDIWNCNSTGVYSGLVATGNGNTADASNLNATFLRGVQKTDSEGVVQFQTIFPGHYSGRTTHIHMVAHLNATVLPNNTLTGGTVGHIGQIFWDQDLIYEVEATYPYNQNNITITTNADDRVFADESATTSDPVIEYVMLGDDISDGIFGWITVAVNVSSTYDTSYSFIYTSSGGVASTEGTASVSDSGTGTGTGMGGNGTMNGTSGAAPSGAFPGGAGGSASVAGAFPTALSNSTVVANSTATGSSTSSSSSSTSSSSSSNTTTVSGSRESLPLGRVSSTLLLGLVFVFVCISI